MVNIYIFSCDKAIMADPSSENPWRHKGSAYE